ncbi:MAG: Gfo/Idh/MocA family protein [Phycisphaerales bacterium]
MTPEQSHSSEQRIIQNPGTPIGIGIIGYGFMGRTHALAYQDAARDGYPCSLVSIADRSRAKITSDKNAPGNISDDQRCVNLEGTQVTDDLDELLNNAQVDIVSVCTQTETHVEIALKALHAGKHVLVEKPIALTASEVQRLADAARETGRVCLPAMCMRVWPAWAFIRSAIQSATYGPVRSASFQRLGTQPDWSSVYADHNRSGGVLHDLHIHDADFIVHCFGMPDAVSTAGDGLHLSTQYHYKNGPAHVSAEAGWDQQAGMDFEMKCRINFEHATLDFDFSRDDQLLLVEGETRNQIQCSSLSGYDQEIRYMLNRARGIELESEQVLNIDQTVQVAKLLEAEQTSMLNKQTVLIAP